MPHLHLSLQAGDDMILKRMKRRHLRQDVIDVCNRARALRPDISFGADIIAGFPTETDEMFANTMKIVTECDLSFLHVFPYSEREGTPAAKMPPVPLQTRKDRAAALRALGETQMQKFRQAQIGRTAEAIIEKNGIGRTEHFAEVQLDRALEAGALAHISIRGIENNILVGEVLNDGKVAAHG